MIFYQPLIDPPINVQALVLAGAPAVFGPFDSGLIYLDLFESAGHVWSPRNEVSVAPMLSNNGPTLLQVAASAPYLTIDPQGGSFTASLYKVGNIWDAGPPRAPRYVTSVEIGADLYFDTYVESATDVMFQSVGGSATVAFAAAREDLEAASTLPLLADTHYRWRLDRASRYMKLTASGEVLVASDRALLIEPVV